MLKGNLEGQINVLNEQINTERMNADHINARIRSIEAEIGEKESQITAYQTDNAGISEAAAKSRKEQEEAEDRLRNDDEHIMLLDQKIEEAKAGIIAGLNEKASLSAKSSALRRCWSRCRCGALKCARNS